MLSKNHIEKLFLFSLMWSLGAVLELDARLMLQEYLLAHEAYCNWPVCMVGMIIFSHNVLPNPLK